MKGMCPYSSSLQSHISADNSKKENRDEMKVLERQIEGEWEFVSLNLTVYTLSVGGFPVLGWFRQESKRERGREMAGYSLRVTLSLALLQGQRNLFFPMKAFRTVTPA